MSLPGANESVRRSVDGVITFPLEPMRITDFEQLGNLVMTSEAFEWLQNWRANRQQLSDIKTSDDYRMADEWETPDWYNRLYPYQRVGSSWLWQIKRGLLGDEMGLGKTAQSLAATIGLKHILVVTVPMAERTVWERHVRDWLHAPAFVCDGDRSTRQKTLDKAINSPNGYTIINHEMLQSRFATAYRALYTMRWDAVILDEAHKFQDAQSSQSKGAQMLKSSRLYLLTGTPIWNRPESVFGLLHLIDPLRWTSYWHFVEEYCRIAITPWAREIVGLKPDKEPQLRSVVSEILLRREKATVLPQLPAKQIQVIAYDLTKEARHAYRQLKNKFRLVLPDGTLFKIEPNVAKAFNDLRRFCNAPVLLDLPYPNPKMEAIEQLLEQAKGEGRPVVLFAWHQDYIAHLDAMLATAGVKHATVAGPMGQAEREQQLALFQQGKADVLIASIGVMGTAVDLTRASVAIFAEGSFVPSHISQAEDRLHRIGQQTDVMIYRLEGTGTIEQAIWNVVDVRADVADSLLAFREVVRTFLQGDDDVEV